MNTETNNLLNINEFSHCENPLFARLSFYLSDAVEEVIENWGLDEISIFSFSEYLIELEINNQSYVLTQAADLKKVLKRDYQKSGQTFTGDVLIDSYKTIYTLSDALYTLEDLENRSQTKNGIESIACELINAVQDLLN